ncbi:BTB/POZ domain-containing protein KCTD6 isoform X2 [Patagioenas fasciata]
MFCSLFCVVVCAFSCRKIIRGELRILSAAFCKLGIPWFKQLNRWIMETGDIWTSELTLPLDFKEFDLLRKEADFYQIEPLIQCLNDPKPLYPVDTFEEVVELSSTRKLSKYSNPVAVIITQLTITTKVHSLLEGISNHFTKWNKHMMDTRDCQVSFTFGPCDYHQEVSLRVHLMEYITKQGFTIRNTRVHHMSERANENTVEHNWTFCRLARKTDD